MFCTSGDALRMYNFASKNSEHYYASILTLSNDVSIDVVSKMLGHTNVRMTQVYAMMTQDKLFEEADKFIEATRGV